MFGTPISQTQWRQINAVGAVLLVIAAVMAVATVWLWRRGYGRTALLVFCWVAAVGCVMHALVDESSRLLSMAGVLHMEYPNFWVSIDRHASDLQDVFLNEPWFLIEGVLWGVLGWTGLSSTRSRRWWLGSAIAAIVALTAIGMLSQFGLIGRFIVF